MNLSEEIALYIRNITFEQLPEEVVHFTKLCIVDYYSSLIKGKDAPPVEMMSAVIRELGGDVQASTITGFQTSVTNAAFVNGGASHVIELDDIHKASIVHAATVILPAALAIAEWKKLTGKDLITAVVVGYEIAFRVGETVSPSHYYYFHNTATCGTFGATAAVAKLLDLSEKQIVEAIGSAGTQAAGLWEFIEDGAMSKQLHPGKAAMNGVLSCLLAQKGFTGAQKILEGRRGFFEAMSEEYDVDKMTDGLGSTYKIMENSFKIHASCRHTHSVMDLLCAYHQTLATKNVDDILKIEIGTYQVALNITDNTNPQTLYAAKFSLQFCAALALLKETGGYTAYTESTLQDSSIRTLMARINVDRDEEIHSKYPLEWGAKISVHWKNGEVDRLQSLFPVGDPENPVSEEVLIAKFNELADSYKKVDREKIIEILLHLEEYQISALIDSVHGQYA
ncbi:MmgE/PrpD family protein [Psychrobacillus antarcticus]|uniref:MmgE/PrpD family protein n=1 Tax=Psychrobacillus antarcticus TaxID=2879115 RepID=UPI002407A423|nr:MmgE/PrpD family protein [Psychrobacillus antarcticus]